MAGDRDNNTSPVIVLFRDDLRVADNHALHAAVQTGRPVLPAFILDMHPEHGRALGAARLWWLHHSLNTLSEALGSRGAKLLLRSGPQNDVIRDLVSESGAGAVYWNRRYDPACHADADLKSALRKHGINVRSFNGALLHEPTQLLTGGGTPFRVFGAFWKALQKTIEPRPPFPAPDSIRAFESQTLAGNALADWHLLPTKPDWSKGMAEAWQPGEPAAHAALDAFVRERIDGYREQRELPSRPGSSLLSPRLANGEISPYQVWHASKGVQSEDALAFLREIAWREFNYHILFHNPDMHRKNYDKSFDGFEWHRSKKSLKAWRHGRTGYPIVDAGMRQLWQTGWMHNRVRLIVGSFLVKHLLIDWRDGESWFWDTLVDADPANNPGNWQWVAGSGVDASPYFRIFNPILQGEKFDKDGAYVRHFVPEVAGLPDKYLHKPWTAPDAVLREARLELGTSYPTPIVDHGEARGHALAAYKATRNRD